MIDTFKIKQDIVECCRRVYHKGYVAANDGNLSVRADANRIICTPTGRSKGFLRVEELVEIDLEGHVIEGDLRPSTEILMHLAVYRSRPDTHAVVHAHPVYATGFATAQIPLDKCVTAEIITTLGSIPLARYGTPSTSELSDAVVDALQNADACLMANHGVVTCGKDIYDAYYKLERVEHYAQIIFVAKLLGGEKILEPKDVKKLEAIRSTYGTQDARNPGCIPCNENCVGEDCSLFEKRQLTMKDEETILDRALHNGSLKDVIRQVIHEKYTS